MFRPDFDPEFAASVSEIYLSKVQFSMNHKLLSIAFAFAASFVGAGFAQAQEAHHPEISIAHRGVGTLRADLTYLLSFTSPIEQKQLDNVLGLLDLMVFGMNEERPIRVDVLSGTTPPTSIVRGPYEVLADLKDDNIAAQYVLKDLDANLSELLPDDTGWFRVLPDIKYAILVFTNPTDHALLKQIIMKLGDPLPGIQSLLEGNANMGVQLVNKTTSPEDQKKRKDGFSDIHSNRLDALQKRPAETTTEFAIRKGLVENQLKELERLLVESLRSSAQIVLDKELANARVLFESEAIADTSYAASLALFGPKADAFTSVARQANSVLSLRANHPIDEFRQANVIKIIDLMREDTVARLKTDDTLNADEKAASQQLFDGIMTVVKDGIKTGNINAFVESTIDDAGQQISFGAASTTDGERLIETLGLIAKTGKGNKITPNLATVGGVTIHEIKLAKGYFELFDRIFGEDKVVFIGTSKNLTWFATGEGSLEVLKKAITDLKEPAESDATLTFDMRLQPVVKRASKMIETAAEPKSLDLQQKRRDALRTLKIATEVFDDKDDVKFEMKVVDGKATGEIFVNTGTLKFLGRMLAMYSKNNLE